MNFIISVFASNVIIIFCLFFYIYISFFVFKNYRNDVYKQIKSPYNSFWSVSIKPDHLFISLFWPICLPFYFLFKILQFIFPIIFNFFDKIVPTILVEKDKE